MRASSEDTTSAPDAAVLCLVLTGRGSDPGLVRGPMIHEWGGGREEHGLLGAGTVAGHIVECGAQCTGGNFTNWRAIPDLARVGYPIIEASADGSFVVTKHEGTGGSVTFDTVAHQLAYEMGDPAAYLTPDVIADFTSFSITEDGTDRVRIAGVKGRPATPYYKVSMSYSDGWKSVGELTISGPEALEKARLCAQIVWDRLASDGCEYAPSERLEEYVGAGVCHRGIADAETTSPPEVVLRMGVKGPDPAQAIGSARGRERG